MKQTNNNQNILVAIDFGTNEVRAMAAEQKAEGQPLHILGMERLSIKRERIFKQNGIITQTTDAGGKLKEILRLLANRIQQPELTQIFHSNLQSPKMLVADIPAHRDWGRKAMITEKALSGLEEECHVKVSSQNPNLRVFSLQPKTFVVDGDVVEDPLTKGSGRRIQANYLAIIGLNMAAIKMRATMEHAIGIDTICKWSSPEALCWALTTNEDSRDGCVILDMGSTLTTLIYYKDGYVQRLKVSPFGSDLLTADLIAYTNNRIDWKWAEALKRQRGVASPELLTAEKTIGVPTIDGDTFRIKTSEIASVIEARLAEILKPLFDKLNYWDTPAHIFVTGGGAMLNGICEYVEKHTGIPTEVSTHAAWLEEGTDYEYFKPTYANLIGTLLLGADYKRLHPNKVEEPSRVPKLIKDAGKFINNLFSEQPE